MPSVPPCNHSRDAGPLQPQAGSGVPALKADTVPALRSRPVLLLLEGVWWVRLLVTQNPINRPGWWKVCFISGAGAGGGVDVCAKAQPSPDKR